MITEVSFSMSCPSSCLARCRRMAIWFSHPDSSSSGFVSGHQVSYFPARLWLPWRLRPSSPFYYPSPNADRASMDMLILNIAKQERKTYEESKILPRLLRRGRRRSSLTDSWLFICARTCIYSKLWEGCVYISATGIHTLRDNRTSRPHIPCMHRATSPTPAMKLASPEFAGQEFLCLRHLCGWFRIVVMVTIRLPVIPRHCFLVIYQQASAKWFFLVIIPRSSACCWMENGSISIC